MTILKQYTLIAGLLARDYPDAFAACQHLMVGKSSDVAVAYVIDENGEKSIIAHIAKCNTFGKFFVVWDGIATGKNVQKFGTKSSTGGGLNSYCKIGYSIYLKILDAKKLLQPEYSKALEKALDTGDKKDLAIRNNLKLQLETLQSDFIEEHCPIDTAWYLDTKLLKEKQPGATCHPVDGFFTMADAIAYYKEHHLAKGCSIVS